MARSPLPGLMLLYLVTRLVGLTALPMFLDESWHISWSMWIPEGKEWDSPWLFGKGVNIFVNALLFPWAGDRYLAATRLVTVLFGGLTLLAVYAAARRLYDERTAAVAALLYLFSPYALFYDRLVLTDPVQSAFATLSLLFCVRAAQQGRARDGALLGLLLALSVFAKASGLLAFLTPALAWLFLARERTRAARAFGVAYATSLALVAWPLKVFFATTSTVRAAVDKSQEGPFGRVVENAPLAWEWVASYWTLPLLGLAAGGLLAALARRERAGLFLGAGVLLPLLAYLAVSSLWFPRYLVFLTPPLSILAGAALVSLLRLMRAPSGAWAGALLLVLLPALRFDFFLWTDPAKAPLPEVERFQFVNGWPSGYGVRDTLAFLREQARSRKGGVRVVLQSGARRTLALASSVEFRYHGFVVVTDLRLDDPAAPATLAAFAREMTTFVVVPMPHRGGRPSPSAFGPARLVLETRKPDGTLCDQVYEMCPDNGCGS
jgi:4-amino-4-deoxy-L-arabinose transferase-like glycosyltransferase